MNLELSKSSSSLNPDFQYIEEEKKESQGIFGNTKNQPLSENDPIYIKVDTYRSINDENFEEPVFLKKGV